MDSANHSSPTNGPATLASCRRYYCNRTAWTSPHPQTHNFATATICYFLRPRLLSPDAATRARHTKSLHRARSARRCNQSTIPAASIRIICAASNSFQKRYTAIPPFLDPHCIQETLCSAHKNISFPKHAFSVKSPSRFHSGAVYNLTCNVILQRHFSL